MAIYENLTKIPRQQLREVGWSKATELVKVARKDREKFDCATWLHKARGLPKERFKGEVERHLTGKETESWETIYFRLYKSPLPVVEKALETASLMLGSDKSRGQKPGPGTRWLAVSRLRFYKELAGPSHETQESVRRRCDVEFNYALRQLSREVSRTAPVETLIAIQTVDWNQTPEESLRRAPARYGAGSSMARA